MNEPSVIRLVFQDPVRARWGGCLLVLTVLGAVLAVACVGLRVGGEGLFLVGMIMGALALGALGPGLVLRFWRREVRVDRGAGQIQLGWRLLGLARMTQRPLVPRARVVLMAREVEFDGGSRTEWFVQYRIEQEHVKAAVSANAELARRWAAALAEVLDLPLIDKSGARG